MWMSSPTIRALFILGTVHPQHRPRGGLRTFGHINFVTAIGLLSLFFPMILVRGEENHPSA
jgi:hypothetical protein